MNTDSMKAIARRGDTVALAEESSDAGDPDIEVMLLAEEDGTQTGPFAWQSLLARGSWEEVPDGS
jgi:hypothetical protein